MYSRTVVADPTDRQRLERALARTYGGERDPWTRVREYRTVTEYAAAHPDEGSAAVASALDLPRSRIRGWVNGDVSPDPVNAIAAADRHGWLDWEWSAPPATGLNVLVAWVLSGGSISRGSVTPSFAVEDHTRATLRAACDVADVPTRVVRDDDDARATEVVPSEHAAVLGRLLATLGAPVGRKNGATDLSLPPYLDSAPQEVRLDFARVYVQNRGSVMADRPATPVQFREERPAAYLREVRAFLRDIVGDEHVRGNAEFVRLTRLAAGVLDRRPSTIPTDDRATETGPD